MPGDRTPSHSVMENTRFIELPTRGSDSIGWLSVAEIPWLPFKPQRAYWTWGVPPSVERGGHAHKKLFQLLVPVCGSVTLRIIDPGEKEEVFLLGNPRRGFLLPPQYWHTTRFSDRSVLLCLASEEYNESDYIRQFDEFIRYWRGR